MLIEAGDDPADEGVAFPEHAGARMGVRWAAAGFVHGVLDGGDITVTGERFSDGPRRFLPDLDPDLTAA